MAEIDISTVEATVEAPTFSLGGEQFRQTISNMVQTLLDASVEGITIGMIAAMFIFAGWVAWRSV